MGIPTWLEKLTAFSKAENQDKESSINFMFEEARETEVAAAEFEMLAGFAIGEPASVTINLLTGKGAEVVDGFADTAFVALSGMRKMMRYMGIPEQKIVGCISQVMDEVCQANLAKLDPSTGDFIYNDAGKIQKPEGWTPPDEKIRKIILDNMQ